MRRLACLIFICIGSVVLAGGVGILWENDVFLSKDNNYTDGVCLYYDEGGSVWGWRSRMYTPEDIENPSNQPLDRPWAGVTTVYHEWDRVIDKKCVRTGWEVGVLGAESGVSWQQKTVHRLIKSRTPMGWSNQVPNEISAQFYQTFYRPMMRFDVPGMCMADLETFYGYCGGTTFDHIFVGFNGRIGWNLPPCHGGVDIEPKAALPKPYGYLFAECQGRYVLHNATLGHSFFRSHSDNKWDRDLIPVVGQVTYGARVGYKNFSILCAEEYRTDEFDDQPEPFKCVILGLEFGVMF